MNDRCVHIPKGHHESGIMPDGQPAPTVMTPGEVIAFLRLDQTGIKDPSLSLRYYREKGLLRGVKIGLKLRYRLTDLLDFLDRLAGETRE